MDKEIEPRGRPADAASRAGRFHPLIYKILAGLAIWFVVSAWIFAGHGRTDYLLAVVSGFVLVIVGLPAMLALTRRVARRRDGAATENDEFGDWAWRDVEIWMGPVRGIVAAVETIVPIAAVALGMTLFGLVLLFAVR